MELVTKNKLHKICATCLLLLWIQVACILNIKQIKGCIRKESSSYCRTSTSFCRSNPTHTRRGRCAFRCICNIITIWLPNLLLVTLPEILHPAARVSPQIIHHLVFLLKTLQWLPIVFKYKFLPLDYKVLHTLASAYFSDLTSLCPSKTQIQTNWSSLWMENIPVQSCFSFLTLFPLLLFLLISA